MDIWTDEHNSTAWDYVGIIDVTQFTSHIEIFRYEDRFPESMVLPEIESNPGKWSKSLSVGLMSQDNPYELLRPLIEFADSIVPEVQRFRTPMYLYGSGASRSMELKIRHELLQASCDYLKRNSSYQFGTCSPRSSYVEGYEQAIFSWLAANYLEKRLFDSNKITVGVIDLASFSLHLGFVLESDKTKSDLYRLGLRKGDHSTKYFDIHAHSYDLFDTVPVDKLAACFQRNTGYNGVNGTGNYDECKAAMDGYVEPLKENLSSLTSPLHIYTVNGLDSFVDRFGRNIDKLRQFCNHVREERDADSDDSDRSDDDEEDSACLGGTLATSILDFAEHPNVTLEHKPIVGDVPIRWTLGRALLQADVELSPRGGKSLGIHQNVGSRKWSFGQEDTLRHLKFGKSSDWLEKFNHQPGRGGGVFLLIGLTILLLMLLGRKGRSRLWAALPRIPQPRGWKPLRSNGNDEETVVELDDIELELSDDFDV